MEIFRKAFLFTVGAVVVAVEQAAKSIEGAAHSFEKERVKLTKRITKNEA